MVDEEIGVVLSLKQKQAMLSGLKEVKTALKETGDTADQASQKAPIAASRWKRFQDRIDGMSGSMKNTGRVGGAMFGVLVANSQGALGPIGEVYDKIAGVGTIMEQTQNKAGKWAIGLGAAMTGAGVVLGTIVSKEQAGRRALDSAIDAAGGHHEDYRKQIEHNINIGHRYGDTAARTTTALNRLVLATRNPQEAFRLYNSVLQISAARHMDVEQVALLVGRAMHGQARSLQAFGFQLTNSQTQQVALTGATKAHKSAVTEVAKAQQNLADVQARLRESHKKTGNSALSVASGHLAVESATVSYNKAVYQHGANSVQAQMAAQRLQIAQGRLNDTMSKGNKATGLTISQQITLRDAQKRLADAQINLKATGDAVATTQKDIAKQGDTADQIIQQTTKYMAGQGAANTNTFTGHLHALAATLDDEVAAGGSHVYKFLTVAGPAMMGVGAVIESGFIPKLGRLFLKITGVQRALDLMKASEVMVGDAALVSGAEVEVGSARAASSGISNFSRLQGAAIGVALAIGAYEVGSRTSGTKGALAGGLMGAVSGMIIGFSVGGPFGAAIGGAVGLLAGLAAHFSTTQGSVDSMSASVKTLGDNLKTSLALGGQEAQAGVRQDLDRWFLGKPLTAGQFKKYGINMDQILTYLSSGGTQLSPGLHRALQPGLDATGKSEWAPGTDLIRKYLPQLLKTYGTAAQAAAGVSGLEGGKWTGGPVLRGHAYSVGEQGIETFVPPSDGTIIPHGATVAALAGMAGPSTGEPTLVQIVLDRKVIGEAMIGYVQDQAARR